MAVYPPVLIDVLEQSVDEAALGFVQVAGFDNALCQFMLVVVQERFGEAG